VDTLFTFEAGSTFNTDFRVTAPRRRPEDPTDPSQEPVRVDLFNPTTDSGAGEGLVRWTNSTLPFPVPTEGEAAVARVAEIAPLVGEAVPRAEGDEDAPLLPLPPFYAIPEEGGNNGGIL
jgi:hypothetical protein